MDGEHFGASCRGGPHEAFAAKSITVGQARGPMGWYDVAIVERQDGRVQMVPIHMMETIELKDAS